MLQKIKDYSLTALFINLNVFLLILSFLMLYEFLKQDYEERLDRKEKELNIKALQEQVNYLQRLQGYEESKARKGK